jgi:hypothetical protein
MTDSLEFIRSLVEAMTNRQKGALHGLKKAENRAWERMVGTAGTGQADNPVEAAIKKLGDDHEHVVAWRKARNAASSFWASIPRRA